ncbi:hypothetical protein AMTRI_Chr11g158210 [Amborella trichopoda]
MGFSTLEIEDMECELFVPLKYSYSELQDESIRQCFLYCSLYTEDYQIEKNNLAECWMCEGLLSRVDNLKDARNKGHGLIDSWMIEEVAGDVSRVKLHDVIRDGRGFIVEAGLGLKESRRVEEWGEVQCISLMGNEIERLPNHPVCRALTTLILRENKKLNNIPEGVRSMPQSLFNLKNLHYLSLHACANQPKQLQVLDFGIKRLPERMGEVTNLKLRNLGWTPDLESIKHGVISRLSSLEELDVITEGCWEEFEELERLRISRNGNREFWKGDGDHHLLNLKVKEVQRRRLPLGLREAQMLREKEWWEGLELEDEPTNSELRFFLVKKKNIGK